MINWHRLKITNNNQHQREEKTYLEMKKIYSCTILSNTTLATPRKTLPKIKNVILNLRVGEGSEIAKGKKLLLYFF